jgi:hypothetical protein
MPVHTVVNSVIIESNIFMFSNWPDLTLNGILPGNVPAKYDWIFLSGSPVLLDPQAWGITEAILATDGSGTYAYGYRQFDRVLRDILKIDLMTGAVLQTFAIPEAGSANSIFSIYGLAWHNGALWGSGEYYDASSVMRSGVFEIVLSNGTSTNQIPASLLYQTGGLASDGTNLYVGIETSNSIAGIIKLDLASSTAIPESPLFATSDWRPYHLSYGDGYLWTNEVELASIGKVDSNSGVVVKKYIGPKRAAGMYHDGKLWMTQNEKLYSFIVP